MHSRRNRMIHIVIQQRPDLHNLKLINKENFLVYDLNHPVLMQRLKFRYCFDWESRCYVGDFASSFPFFLNDER